MKLRVSIEDTGPILEAICAARYAAFWEDWDLGKRAEIKQAMLDMVLPGLEVFINQVNEQLAEMDATADPDVYRYHTHAMSMHRSLPVEGCPACEAGTKLLQESCLESVGDADFLDDASAIMDGPPSSRLCESHTEHVMRSDGLYGRRFRGAGIGVGYWERCTTAS